MKIQFGGNQQYQLGLAFTELGVGNQITLGPETIFANLKATQQRGSISQAAALESLDFTVEMETGTGKTCVYLRAGRVDIGWYQV